jgi:hypothetical protein
MLIRKFFLILKSKFFVKPVFGTPNVEIPEKRREIALDHLAKSLRRPKQFKAAMDVPTITPPFLHFFPVAGDTERRTKAPNLTPRSGCLS